MSSFAGAHIGIHCSVMGVWRYPHHKWLGIERATNPALLWALTLFIFSTLAYFQKREHYLAALWKTFLFNWTCSCTVLWHYVKLSSTIRCLDLLLHLRLLSTTLSCQIWSLAQNKSLLVLWIQCPDWSDFQLSSVLAKCQVHQPY